MKLAIFSLIRHFMTALSGWLVSANIISAEAATTIFEKLTSGVTEFLVATVLGLVALSWSFVEKKVGINKPSA